MDARSTRVQAQESLKMSKDSDKQAKTLMVFTVVTIIFVCSSRYQQQFEWLILSYQLPMSFMATFFAIPAINYPDDSKFTFKGGLGKASEIMCKA
jgi:multidrug efflux pump subunit AcrB